MARPVSGSLIFAELSSASEARFSADGLQRLWLIRRWSAGNRTLLFIGLNPSRADQRRDDPTLRRLIGFGHSWGYDALVVVNLFARISPSPAALLRCADPIGPEADAALLRWSARWARTEAWDLWCGWGNGGCRWQRDRQVRELLDPLLSSRSRGFPRSAGPLSLGCTKRGHPRHPLYASKESTLQPFVWAGSASIRHPEVISKHRRSR